MPASLVVPDYLALDVGGECDARARMAAKLQHLENKVIPLDASLASLRMSHCT